MPEAPDLHSLFVQLQTRYPTSGLLTELVQIHADHFIVRALVQLGSMTLATSLATAETVEQAEDQARLRVLALLGIYPAQPGFSEQPFPSYSASALPLAPTFKPITPPAEALDSVARQDYQTPTVLPDVEVAIESPRPFPALTFEPVPLADSPHLPVSTASLEPPASLSYAPEIPLETFGAPSDDEMPEDRLPDRDVVLYDAVSYEDAPDEDVPFEEPEPLVEVALDRDRTSTDATAKTVEEPAVKSKPRKPSASKEPSPPAAHSLEESSGQASRDLSSLISQIGVEIDRIGWSKRQGSTYLQKTYGKKTRSELTDDELEDFLTYLNTQPSASEA